MLCPTCSRDNPSDAQFCNGCGATLDTAVAEAPTGVLISSSFVGRQREMGELISTLDDAISGHGRLVMLAGEPGIGKTRTVQELASAAESRGGCSSVWLTGSPIAHFRSYIGQDLRIVGWSGSW